MSRHPSVDYQALGAQCRLLYESGMSTHSIARDLTKPQSAVRKALMAVGVELRTKALALKMTGRGRKASDAEIVAAFVRTKGNVVRSASELGVSDVALYLRMQKIPALREALKHARSTRFEA